MLRNPARIAISGGRIGGVALLAAALAGCSTMPLAPEPAELGMALPDGWSDNGAGEITFDEAAYWEALDDPVLTELVEAALANNLDLAQSATRLAQAREGLVQARAGFLPQLTAGGNAVRGIGDGTTSDITTSLGLDASWEVDLFGRIGNSAQASSYNYQSAGYALADLRRAIAGQVALQVISARSTRHQLAVAETTLDIQNENLQIARWRNQAGLVSSLDVEQARSARAQTSASIPLLESNLAATANAISTLIGEPPGRVREMLYRLEDMPEPPTLASLDAPADLLRRRPDIRGAEAVLLADTAQIGVSRAQLYPSLSLTGSIGTNDGGSFNLFDLITGSVFAGVSQLLFDGGRTRSRIRAAEAVAEGSLAGWQKSILSALEEVENAIISRRAADARLIDIAEAQDAANNAALLARSQYQAGLTDFQTLLNAESQLLSARNSLVSAQADRASAFVRLTQAMGGGWDPDVPVESLDDRNTP